MEIGRDCTEQLSSPYYVSVPPSCDLILALDLPDRNAVTPMLRKLHGSLSWVKIGLQMFTAYGPDYVKAVADEGFKVFLDLKLHDIPNTVAKAVESLSALPIDMLTIHTSGGSEMMMRANQAKESTKPDLLLLGVTVLTSMDKVGLREIGVSTSSPDQVKRLGKLAARSGLKGLVCSPLEVANLRRELSADIQLITPGIRPAGQSGADDQKRVMTPREAAQAGSTHIVVGRPILQSPDPVEAARAILAELSS